MKAAQREIYKVLAAEIDWHICSFCKWTDGSFCSGDYGCYHPLAVISEEADCSATDCWGYRPRLKVQDVADIVGIILSEGFNPFDALWQLEDGQIKVYGRKKGKPNV